MQISPLIYNEKGHRIASDDDVLDPKHIKVSADKANVLTNDEAGLAVKAEDLVSVEEGNLLSVGADGKLKAAASDASTLVSAESDNTLTTGADGKLYVPPVELTVDVLSKDDGNMLRYGSDEGLFLDGNDVLSNGDKNLLKINGIDGLIELTKETLESAGFLSGQAKIAGVQPNDPLLSLDSAGFLSTSFDVEYDETTGLTKFKGADGRVAATVSLPVAVKIIRSVTLETNPVSQGEGVFLHFVFEATSNEEREIYLNVDKLFNVYKAGNGIDISTDGVISTVVSDMVALEPDNVIQEKDGKLYVSPISVYGELVSSDPDNIITKGTDQRVFLGKAQLDVAMNSIVQEGAMKLVSQDENNVLTEGADKGAMLSKDSLASAVQEQITGGKVKVVSADLQNTITEGSDKGAYLSEASFGEAFTKVRKAGLLKVVSEDATNVITEGTDKGALLSKAQLGTVIKEGVTSGDVVLTSKDQNNLLQSGADGGSTLTKERLESVVGGIIAEGDLTVVSTDGGNVVKEGSDRGAYLSKADFKSAVTEAVQSKGSGVVSSNMDNVIKEGPDGGANLSKEDFAAAMEEAIQGGTVPLVSTDGDNLIIEGGDGGAFLDTAAIGSAIDDGLADGSIDLISTDPNNLAKLGSDHKVFAEDKYDQYLPLTGGTVTGPLTVEGTLTFSNMDAGTVATKEYVEEYVKKNSGGGLSIGHFLLWPYKTAPLGFVLANGDNLRRDTYASLWSFLEANPELVKTEGEWQEIAGQSNGYCSFYSSGDGENTFRVPKFAPYIQVSGDGLTATEYHEAGLPNIEAKAEPFRSIKDDKVHTGAFLKSIVGAFSPGYAVAGSSSANDAYNASLTFDASDSNAIYGKSETVQPESHEWNVVIAALEDHFSATDPDLKALNDTLKNFMETVDTVLPLGHFFSWPFKTPPAGALHANGEEVRRVTYDALWQYVQLHPEWLKTETEWQKIAAQDNGYCAYYSDGDGVDTFRLPKFAPFQQFVNNSADGGRYNPDNIGNLDIALRVADKPKQDATKAYQEGAILEDYTYGCTGGWINGGLSNGNDEYMYQQRLATNFTDRAGDLISTYERTGDHIIPESSNWITCIIAYAPVSAEKEIKYEELKQTIQEFTQSVDSIVPLGQFFSWPYKEAPAGALVCNGGEYNRALYKDLWAMVQAHPSWMKTDTEWNEIATANGGYCPYYSDGDGAYTFRIPKFAPFVKNITNSADPGIYAKDGLVAAEGAVAELETHTWSLCVVAFNTKAEDGTVSLEELRRLIVEAKQAVGLCQGRGYNSVMTITDSEDNWNPPVTGWYKVTVIGGGGGGAGGYNSYITAQNNAAAGGGGGSGGMVVAYLWLVNNNDQGLAKYSITIGAGGAGGKYAGGDNGPGKGGGDTVFIGEAILEERKQDVMEFSLTAGGGFGGAGPYDPSKWPDGAGFYLWGGPAGGAGGENTIVCSPENVVLDLPGFAGSTASIYNNAAQGQGSSDGGTGGGYGGGAYGLGSGKLTYDGKRTSNFAYGHFGGGGGGAVASIDSGNYRSDGGDGAQGCVIIEWYDPEKATSYSCPSE